MHEHRYFEGPDVRRELHVLQGQHELEGHYQQCMVETYIRQWTTWKGGGVALRDTPAKQALVAELMADPAFRAMLEPDPDDGIRYTMPVELEDTFGDLMDAIRGLQHVNVIVFDDDDLDGVMHVRTDDDEPSRGHQSVDPAASVGLVVAFVRAMGLVDLRSVHRQIDLHPVG